MKNTIPVKIFTPHGAQISIKRINDGTILLKYENKPNPTVLTFTALKELMAYLEKHVFRPVLGG